MQLDIDMELENFETMEYEGEPNWTPLFDPKKFCENKADLKINDYRLNEDEL